MHPMASFSRLTAGNPSSVPQPTPRRRVRSESDRKKHAGWRRCPRCNRSVSTNGRNFYHHMHKCDPIFFRHVLAQVDYRSSRSNNSRTPRSQGGRFTLPVPTPSAPPSSAYVVGHPQLYHAQNGGGAIDMGTQVSRHAYMASHTHSLSPMPGTHTECNTNTSFLPPQQSLSLGSTPFSELRGGSLLNSANTMSTTRSSGLNIKSTRFSAAPLVSPNSTSDVHSIHSTERVKLSEMQRVIFLQQLCFLRVYDRKVDAACRHVESTTGPLSLIGQTLLDAMRHLKAASGVCYDQNQTESRTLARNSHNGGSTEASYQPYSTIVDDEGATYPTICPVSKFPKMESMQTMAPVSGTATASMPLMKLSPLLMTSPSPLLVQPPPVVPARISRLQPINDARHMPLSVAPGASRTASAMAISSVINN